MICHSMELFILCISSPGPRPSTENHDHDNGIQRPAYVESLSQRLALLTEPRPNDDVPPGLIESLPPEVLLVIFSHLDDIALYAVGNVCRRWRIVLRDYINSSQWKVMLRMSSLNLYKLLP